MFLSFGWLLFVSGWVGWWVVVWLWWGVVLSVLGVVVTFRVVVWMGHLQSDLYCRCCIIMCALQMNPMCVVCVVTFDWGLFLVYLFVTEVTNPNYWSVFVCVCRRARIWLDVPRFCEEQGQPGGRERWPACPKTEWDPYLWRQGLCRHKLCRCRLQSNLVQAVSSWTIAIVSSNVSRPLLSVSFWTRLFWNNNKNIKINE